MENAVERKYHITEGEKKLRDDKVSPMSKKHHGHHY